MKRASMAVGALAILTAVVAPAVVRADATRADSAAALGLLVASLGLAVAVGPAGAPSLAQGAFVGLGAYATAVLQARHGWDPLPAALAAIAVSVVAGAVLAAAVRALRPAFVAVATWTGAWAFTAAVAAFPSTTGGARGLVPPDDVVRLPALGLSVELTPLVVYETAVGATLVAVWVVTRFRRRARAALVLARDDPSAALAAGVPVARLRAAALVLAAALGGAAGVLLLQARGVADPSAYGPLLSVQLLLVVLVGGADTVLGPAIGLVALAVAGRAGDERLVTAALLLAALALRTRFEARPRRDRWRSDRADGGPTDAATSWDGAAMSARGIHVRFGGVVALDGVDVDVAAGSVHGIVGGNGSGKTTLLRVLAGVVDPDRGVVVLDGRDVTKLTAGARRVAGVARTLQRAPRAGGVRAVDVVVAGAEPARGAGPGGIGRALFATPAARAEHSATESRARALLDVVGAGEVADEPYGRLGTGMRRLVQVAAALAGGARVLLLDEPSAGGDARSDDRLREAIDRVRDAGLTVVVVEHHLGLVAAVADRVTVLEAGHVVAAGAPHDVLPARAG